jgi:pyrimidine dimer DNA glycosylase
MQTFLPYPDFSACARVLDSRRLGKQRVETLQILRGLTVAGYGWRHHPAVRMWRGYEEALVRYGLEMCAVWTAAGRGDTVADTLLAEHAGIEEEPGTGHATAPRHSTATAVAVRSQPELAATGQLPPWFGDEAFHRSHRSALRRKDPGHYAAAFPDTPDDLPYVWPSSG